MVFKMEYYETEVIYQHHPIQQDKNILLVDDVKIQTELIVMRVIIIVILILEIQIEVVILI